MATYDMTTLAIHGMSFMEVNYETGHPSGGPLTTWVNAPHSRPSMKVLPTGVELMPYTGGTVTMYALMPVPSIVGIAIMRLRSITLLYNTTWNAKIEEIQVYDGSRLLRTFPLDWSGSYEQPSRANSLDLGDSEVHYGLAVVVRSSYALEPDLRLPEPYGVVRLFSLRATYVSSETTLHRWARLIFGTA
jgi:hypothetical protein